MVRTFSIALTVVVCVAWVRPVRDSALTPSTDPPVIEVRMYDKGGGQWGFEPEHVVTEQGSIVRFVMDDVVPHNVEFRESPPGVDFGPIRMGPFLLQRGDTYDVRLDQRFVPGLYKYVCTPHSMLGMVGSIEVKAAPRP